MAASRGVAASMRAPRRPSASRTPTVVTLGRREWVALHTPGHTPDHLCLFDPDDGVAAVGRPRAAHDHAAHLGHRPRRRSRWRVLRLARPDDRARRRHQVLPAHGHPFDDLAGPGRASRTTTRSGSTRLRSASAELGRAASVRELMQHLFSPAGVGPMAESETYAHLEHLRLAGQADAAPRTTSSSTPSPSSSALSRSGRASPRGGRAEAVGGALGAGRHRVRRRGRRWSRTRPRRHARPRPGS